MKKMNAFSTTALCKTWRVLRAGRHPGIAAAFVFVLISAFSIPAYSADGYENFDAAIYARVYEVQKMKDLEWLEPRFDVIQEQVKVDKIYLETHRDMVVAEQSTITRLKEFFENRGVRTSGGITLTVNERNRFETYCYTNPEHRARLVEVVEFTARNFDEVILDDFFFTNCKCPSCIEAKGDRSWTEFRLDLLTQAAQELILEPARRVNPGVKVIIKYPNWYEHFQGLGFNLETGPKLFDGLYTGTETRDPSSNQHLQAYLGYLIFRYFENLKPGGNRGGWVDTGGSRYIDRYAEQLWLTLFARAPEITLFDFRQMMRPIRKEERGEWQGRGTSFDFDAMIEPVRRADGSWPEETGYALAAGYALQQADAVLGELGNPVGIKSYKPYHSVGEDFLQTYFGMIGIPMDLVPKFPVDAGMVVLTESASFDPDVVNKMKQHLINGNDVLITSGLLRVLQEKGLGDIAELRYTDRKAVVKNFRAGWGPYLEAETEMIIPQIQYLTNDSWEEISAMDGTNGWPLLHSAGYGDGTLYVLAIPESFTDLYSLPIGVLNRIRQTVMRELPLRIEGPAQVSFFLYDNDTFIAESFLSEDAELNIITRSETEQLMDLLTGKVLAGEEVTGWGGRKTGELRFRMTVKPHSYRVFRGR